MIASAPAPAVTGAVLSKWRARIEHWIRKFDLLAGIQRICKGHYKRLADYQVAIIRECFKRCPEPSVILGGREIAKTMSIALGYFLRCLVEPGFEVYLVPGQKIDQAKAALRYVNILCKYSKVCKPISGLNRKNIVEWSTMHKSFTNNSLMSALAPNEGVVSEHGCVWCDEYQFLPEEVDVALQGFTGRVGDRMLLSGTANVRGSPLHRAHKVAEKRYPQNVVEVKVQAAIDAGILSKPNIEAKRMENGGKLSPVEFDAWFNCKWPDLGTLGWHPIESSYTRKDMLGNPNASRIGTGMDPGIPVNRACVAVRTATDEVHIIDEFEIGDMEISSLHNKALGQLHVEYGEVFGGGYNKPFHSILDLQGIAHRDSYVDGDARDDLFAGGFKLQAQNRLFVNPITCPNLWSACEQQTFDDKGEMDRLPLTHWIFAMLIAIRSVITFESPMSLPANLRPKFRA